MRDKKEMIDMAERKDTDRKSAEFEEKRVLFEVDKNEDVSIVITLLKTGDNAFIDIRERVKNPEGDWNGWTKRGIAIPLESAAEIVEKLATALDRAKAKAGK